MRHLYIFDIHSYSTNNGVGKYIMQLEAMTKLWKDFHVSMIMFQTNVESLFVGYHKGIEYFFFPRNNSGHYQDNAREICIQLTAFIKDSKNTIFLLNYAPCEKLLYALKQTFPLSTCIFALHDIRCLGLFMGDVDAIQNLLEQNKMFDGQQNDFRQVYDNEKRQLIEADNILCFCTDSYELLKDFYQIPEQKIVLIPHGIETEEMLASEAKSQFKEEKGIKDDEIILLSVGRISKPKGFYDYLESFKMLLLEGYNCKWIVIGDSRFAESFREKAGDALSRIIQTGFLNANELYKWYQIADIGIMPSYFEQCSYVGLEMMANGLPVVASDSFGVRCMFQHHVNALVAPMGNRNNMANYQKQLTQCTIELIMNHSLRQKLRINSFRKIKEVYNLNNMHNAYKTILYG